MERGTGTSDVEITRRIAMARARFSNMRTVLRNYRVDLRIRVDLFRSCIRSRLCYCAETWALTARQLQRLESAQLDMLRGMIRGGHRRASSQQQIDQVRERAQAGNKSAWDDIDWGYTLAANRIYSLVKLPKVSDFVSAQQERWIKHLLRRPNESLSKQFLFLDERWAKGGNRRKTVFEVVTERAEREEGTNLDAYIKQAREPLTRRPVRR